MLIELNMLDMRGLPVNIDILLFGNDDLSVGKMQISKVDETYCVLRYNIWQIEHTSKDNS
jgi:hypothetical protein